MSRTAWITVAALIALVGALAGVVIHRRAATAVPTAEAPLMAVQVVAVEPRMWPEQVVADGPVAAWQETVIAAETGGLRIAEVLAEAGDRVASGQLLARLDDRTAAAELAQAEAAAAQARAEAAKAEAEARRNRDAVAVLSAVDAERSALAASAAAASARAAEAQAEAARLRRDRTAIRAPDAGTILARTAVPGAVAQVGSELFRLARQDRIVWRPALLPADAARLAPGAPVEVVLAGGATAAGILRRLPTEIDARTRTGAAEVDLPVGSARPGEVLAGRLQVGAPRPVATLPLDAVVLRDGRHEVVVIDASDRARLVRVRTGRVREGRIELLDPAPPAERIVATGGAFLGDGDLVRVVP